MHKSELLSKLNDLIAMEDDFVERIAQMDLTTLEYSDLKVTSHLKVKNGLMKLLDDSRRHKEIMISLSNILAGDGRDEY